METGDLTTTHADSLTVLTRKRGSLKTRLTKFSNFLSSADQINFIAQIKIRLKKITDAWDEFQEIQSKIENIDDTVTQSEERENFEEHFYEVVAAAEELLDNSTPTKSPVQQQGLDNIPDLKLPSVNLPIFDGSIDNWPTFSQLYIDLIHNSSISKIRKFQYLRACLKGESANIIESLHLSEVNYDIAWSLLVDRFQNTNQIIMRHVHNLLNLPRVERESSSALHTLLDNVRKHLRALKGLGQPVDQWDTLLVYWIGSKLDNTTLKDWKRHSASFKDELPSFSNLTDFIQQRCQVLEELSITLPSTNSPNRSTYQTKQMNLYQSRRKGFEPKTSFHATQLEEKPPSESHSPQIHKTTCILCSMPHYIYECPKFLQSTITERWNKAQILKLCVNCLRTGHKSTICRAGKCKKCGNHHNTLLHKEALVSKGQTYCVKDSSTETTTVPSVTSSHTAVNKFEPKTKHTVLMATAIVDLVDQHNNSTTVRALLDSGSQCNFISERLCQTLRLPRSKTCVLITGVGSSQTTGRSQTRALIRSKNSNYCEEVEFLVLPKITGHIPAEPIDTSTWVIPKDITLADPTFSSSSRIDLLIGSEIFWNLICAGAHHLPNCGIHLRETKLGWILAGRANFQKSQPITCNLSTVKDINHQITRFWTIEDCDQKPISSPSDKHCETHYSQTTRRKEDGRYIVNIPLLLDPTNLGDSRELALRRFLAVERRLRNNKNLRKDYIAFMREYELLGHMKALSSEEVQSLSEHSYFLPHHAVFKGSSTTTKVRVVFDASAKTTSGFSLNDISFTGPTIQDDLFSIIVRFRTHNYVICGDLEKMFRQVEVDPSQTNLQLIYWREKPEDPLRIYRLLTITYGTAGASFLATRTLHQLAHDEEKDFMEASKVVLQDFYMDDLLTGCCDFHSTVKLQRELSTLLLRGGFHIRKWNSNSRDVLEQIPPADRLFQKPHPIDQDTTYKTLGLIWKPINDTFSYSVDRLPETQYITKRQVLSTIARIFDPLGLIGPVITRAKILMQRLWTKNLGWDDKVPEPLVTDWKTYHQSLKEIEQLNIPRQITCKETSTRTEIHGFSDASESAYGACAYLRTTDCGRVTVHLIASKSRVAPLKSISLPRLELCGALLLTLLMENIKKALRIKIHATYLWTDSTIVLAWIRSTPARWTTFVRNRVSKIQDLSNPDSWGHVIGTENPADAVSRGIDGDKIKGMDLWWKGPPWLALDQRYWIPQSKIDTTNIHLPDAKDVEMASFSVIANDDVISRLITKHSSFKRLRAILSYCLRFIHNARYKDSKRHGRLTSEEYYQASLHLIQKAQEEVFLKEIKTLTQRGRVDKKSKIASLSPFLDNNVLRVGGRLQKSTLTPDQIHPLILPKHPLTVLIAKYEHTRLMHAGPQSLLSSLRLKYWPIGGRNLVRKIVRQCIVCFKANPPSTSQQMGELPKVRIQKTRPFLNSGVDYCGPFLVKVSPRRGSSPSKAYIALFVCLSTKALHLEVVENMSTSAFLNAFSRFVSRRGKPHRIFSDNGRNFVGAQRELTASHLTSSIEAANVEDNLANDGIQWSFIPPGAPNFGGLWESGVRLIKYHIRRVVGNSIFSFPQFNTLTIQIEAIVNSRPIIPLSSDPSDLIALTPSHFLVGDVPTNIPQPNLTVPKTNLREKWQHAQQLMEHFWRRWSTQYLSELQTRSKWKEKRGNVEIGRLILIKEDNLPPAQWKLGRIIETHPGADGLVRVVTVKTAQGNLKRALSKICPLLVHLSGLILLKV